MFHIKTTILVFLVFTVYAYPQAHYGYDLWLGYEKIGKPNLLKEYKDLTKAIYFEDGSDVLNAAKKELITGMEKMLGSTLNFKETPNTNYTLLIAKVATMDPALTKKLSANFDEVGSEGFVLKSCSQRRYWNTLWGISTSKFNATAQGFKKYYPD